ncbi:MAG: phosphotransferase [Chitinispirillales bacterium]|jgi:aminoglycoside/choline kinase family phosphotransferase|nr:phosphotransferase [Chitinispirillales bacterium]
MELTEGEPAPIELTPAQASFLCASVPNFNLLDWAAELAGQAASTRRFFRVFRRDRGESYILVEWDSKDEDWPRFLGIAEHLSPSIPFLPKIYASDALHGLILEEDLGVVTLKQFCVDHAGEDLAVEDMYREVIDALTLWHSQDVANCQSITSRAMDAETFLWETGYFARHCAIEFFANERLLTPRWENERQRMAECAASIPVVCMHRDFQSENVLICGSCVRFVDFQGARLGPPHYDAASLLFDPYVDLGYDTIERLVNYYLVKTDSVSEENAFYLCAAQRLMQALGAYGNLSLHKGKPRYRDFIPPALKKLSFVLTRLPDYPAMKEVADGCQC